MNIFACFFLRSCFLFILLGSVAHSASISYSCNLEVERLIRGCSIVLSGPIEKGDASRFKDILKRPLPEGWRYNDLILDSMGGEVDEAIAIAKMVKEAVLKTTTMDARWKLKDIKPTTRLFFPCVSACFLVWVAGAERFSYQTVEKGEKVGLGLHRPFFSSSTYRDSPSVVADKQARLMLEVRSYLKGEQISDSLIDKMMHRSSKEIYWLDENVDGDLSGIAPWFEELLISRCDYDPAYRREQESEIVKRLNDKSARPASEAKFIKWMQAVNYCKYEIIRSAQSVLRN